MKNGNALCLEEEEREGGGGEERKYCTQCWRMKSIF
jgi:hypothetical protein